MKTQITVNELVEQLHKTQEMGRGNDLVWFRDWNDIDHEVEEGVYDSGKDWVALG